MMSGQSDLKSVVPKLFEDLGLVEHYGEISKFINYEIFLLALSGVVCFLWVDWGGAGQENKRAGGA